MKMKAIVKVFIIVCISCASVPMLANAVSWSPIAEEHEEKVTKGIVEKGASVCLFQSGTADVRKGIHVNDILIVYRENQGHQLKEVGKIKIISYVGEDYLKAEVVEGGLMPGDIAKKGEVATLVISSSDKCK